VHLTGYHFCTKLVLIMQKYLLIIVLACLTGPQAQAQPEPKAGTWPTWLITSGQSFRLPAPQKDPNEIKSILAIQKNLDSATLQTIAYWHVGTPAYRWQQLMESLWMDDALNNGMLSHMLMSVAIYDATVAAWDSKYAHSRLRPYEANKEIKKLVAVSESPSYPCEYAVTAGVAATILTHFFPNMADSVQYMSEQVMSARVAAGMAYPSDTKAGFELGQQIALREIAATEGYLDKTQWDGKIPDRPGVWKGAFAFLPYGGRFKTMVLTNGSQFRPGPPPDYAAEMAELKNYQQTQSSMYNALRFDQASVWDEIITGKIALYQLNAPRAARVYAATAIALYDAFVACWDAKYTYWGIRPEQYDPTFKPLLGDSPPFPGYPSGHAATSASIAEVMGYLFPAEQAEFRALALQVAESRFQGGIHFRSDNVVANDLGKKVGQEVVKKMKRGAVKQ
jgi:membrane-associated phospholipid phosphatase